MHGACSRTLVPRLVLLALAGVQGACGSKGPARAPTLELSIVDADVWSFELFVQGRADTRAQLDRCQLTVGDQHFEATTQGDGFSGTVALQSGQNTVSGLCRFADGSTLRAPAVQLRVPLASLSAEPRLTPEQLDTAAWANNIVVYGVVPTLFGAPPLEAVTHALDQLRDLGVNVLWLAPIFDAPEGDFGYAVKDPFQVRPSYGSAQDLARLVEQAHARDMRIVLDLVPNHTSDQHPYFVQATKLGQRSHYYDFYDRDGSGQPTHYFDWNHLPNLNYRNAEVARYTISAALHWLTSAHVDGYRVDTAWGIKQRKPDFWPLFRAELKQAAPDVWLLAQASARDPYYVAHGFDAAYDWSDELGHAAWEHVFDAQPGIAKRLLDALKASGPVPERVLRSLNTNDDQQRFITRHGEPLTRVATAALLTLPGIPCLYAFDEVGAEYLPRSQQAPVQHQNGALRDFHKKLIGLRRAQPALHAGSFVPLHASEEDEVLVFARVGAVGEPSALVALNFAAQPKRLTVALPDTLKLGRLTDAFAKRTLNAGKQVALSLTPYDAQVWLSAARKR